MNGFQRVLTTAFMSAAMLFTGAMAQAMQIVQFDRMADHDQDEYVADLIIGAQKVLNDSGDSVDAAKVHKLFEVEPGAKSSEGMAEFEMTLARVRLKDTKNAIAHPESPRLEVEDAMALTLQINGIELPDAFFTVAKDFKPKFPAQKKK
jgi:hypothetical protein